ncbi:MAG: hypothetical protein HFI26_11875 [Lachnospiraceae bacterium]|jgi:RinA family phage transcriptional activator|nr:hypothetical protein [Lachnospiraceae bacterium]
MNRIPKDSWAIIERVIRRYPESKKEYIEVCRDVVDARPESLLQSGIVLGGIPGNPTEKAVMKIMDTPRMRRLYREIQAVEAVYNQLPADHQKVIRVRFWSDRERKISYLRMAESVNYKEAQMRRISGKFVRDVGKRLGEI